METIDRTKPILVTGGSGYLASWIVKQLLEQGIEVRTTVRNLTEKDKFAHLTSLAVKSTGTLQFFEADLQDLGMDFIAFEKTITDHFQQLLNDGIIKKR